MIRRVMAMAAPDAINLALGELRYPFPDLLRQKAIELMQSAEPSYTPNAGILELRKAISDYYGKNASWEQVCVCNGAEEALFVLATAILNPGDVVAIPDPDYSAYPSICSMMQADILRLPMRKDLRSVDLSVWEEQLSSGVKMLLLSNPQNPGGFYFDNGQMRDLLDICRKYNVIPVVDEIYRELYLKEPISSFWGMAENLFIIGGLSKSHQMSGWRLGWLLSPKEFSPHIISTRQYVSTCSNWLSQYLACYALSVEGMNILSGVRASLKHSQSIVLDGLKDCFREILIPNAGPYIMCKTDIDDLEYATKLAAKGVIVVPVSAFGELGKGWIRINHAVEDELLIRAMGILKALR